MNLRHLAPALWGAISFSVFAVEAPAFAQPSEALTQQLPGPVLASASTFPDDDLANAFAAIAATFLEAGEIDRAVAIAASALPANFSLRTTLLAEAARQYTMQGQTTKARQVSEEAGSTASRVRILTEIAVAQDRVGQSSAASTTLSQALQLAKTVETEPQAIWALGSVVTAYIRLQQLPQARQVAQEIPNFTEQLHRLISIADYYRMQGQSDEANAVLAEVEQRLRSHPEDTCSNNIPIRHVVSHHALAGSYDQALAFAQALTAPCRGIQALLNLAQEHLLAANPAQAIALMRAAETLIFEEIAGGHQQGDAFSAKLLSLAVSSPNIEKAVSDQSFRQQIYQYLNEVNQGLQVPDNFTEAILFLAQQYETLGETDATWPLLEYAYQHLELSQQALDLLAAQVNALPVSDPAASAFQQAVLHRIGYTAVGVESHLVNLNSLARFINERSTRMEQLDHSSTLRLAFMNFHSLVSGGSAETARRRLMQMAALAQNLPQDTADQRVYKGAVLAQSAAFLAQNRDYDQAEDLLSQSTSLISRDDIELTLLASGWPYGLQPENWPQEVPEPPPADSFLVELQRYYLSPLPDTAALSLLAAVSEESQLEPQQVNQQLERAIAAAQSTADPVIQARELAQIAQGYLQFDQRPRSLEVLNQALAVLQSIER